MDMGTRSSLDARVLEMERPFAIDHLDHLVLRVRDLDKSVAFYTMLGGRVHLTRQDTTSILLVPPSTRVTLKHEAGFMPPQVGNLDHINLAVRARDIAEVEAYLRANGARIVEDLERESGSPTVRVFDPDENIVEIRLVENGI